MGHGGEFWQNVIHWEGIGRPLQYSCHEQYESMTWKETSHIWRGCKLLIFRVANSHYSFWNPKTGNEWSRAYSCSLGSHWSHSTNISVSASRAPKVLYFAWILLLIPCEYYSDKPIHVLSNFIISCCCHSFSCVLFFATPWTTACQVSPSFTISQSLLKLMSVKSVMPLSHLILCHPLLLPSIFASIRVLSNETALCIMWPKYWSFSFSFSPSNEYSGLISFRIDWFDFLAVQGTLKSLLQHHSLKASILWHSTYFMVQLSHPYMTTGKTIGLTIRTLVDKVMSLLFNMLSRFVITFLPRSKRLLISWLQSWSTVVLEPTWLIYNLCLFLWLYISL